MSCLHSIIEPAKEGSIDILRKIFDDNPLHPVDGCDRYGKTALLYAAQNNHLNVLEFLVGEGADVKAVDINNNTALALSVNFNHYDMAKYLIGLGLSTNCTFNHNPIIHVAISNENIDMIETLLDNGADPTVSNYQGFDCQQMAKRCLDDSKMCKFNELLIEHGWI
jgi:ankyrin repeat protein